MGFVIEYNGVTVYHAGDTVIYEGLIETLSAWTIDVAFVPINGGDFSAQPRASSATRVSERRRSSPKH